MAGNKVWGKFIPLCVVLMSCFLLAGFVKNDSEQGEQSPLSFYEKLLLSGEEAFFSGEYNKAIKELEIAAFGLFQRKYSAAKAYVLISLSHYHLDNRDSAGGFLKEAARLLVEKELKELELSISDSDRAVLEKLIQEFDVFSGEAEFPIFEEVSPSKEKSSPTPVKKEPEKKKIPENVDERIAQLVQQRKKQQPEQLKVKDEVPVKKEAEKKTADKNQENISPIKGLEELFVLDDSVQEQTLSDIWINKGTSTLDVGIVFQPDAKHQVFEITNIPPKRIVIDIHNIKGIEAGRSIDINDFGITSIRTGMFKDNIARVVFDAVGDLPIYRIEKTEDGLRVVIEKQPLE